MYTSIRKQKWLININIFWKKKVKIIISYFIYLFIRIFYIFYELKLLVILVIKKNPFGK